MTSQNVTVTLNYLNCRYLSVKKLLETIVNTQLSKIYNINLIVFLIFFLFFEKILDLNRKTKKRTERKTKQQQHMSGVVKRPRPDAQEPHVP